MAGHRRRGRDRPADRDRVSVAARSALAPRKRSIIQHESVTGPSHAARRWIEPTLTSASNGRRVGTLVEMAREGVPLVIIQRQLSHTNLGITSIYLQGIDNTEIIDTVHARHAPMVPVDSSLRRERRDRRR